MSTRIPLTIEGNLVSDPEPGVSANQTEWTRFRIAVNERRLNEETKQWEDGDSVFHDVAVFGKQAKHAAASLRKGDAALVAGHLRFGSYVDKETGAARETRQVVADTVAASLKHNDVEVVRSPKAKSPELHATGPFAAPVVETGAQYAR